jgi:hypothetical protein
MWFHQLAQTGTDLVDPLDRDMCLLFLMWKTGNAHGMVKVKPPRRRWWLGAPLQHLRRCVNHREDLGRPRLRSPILGGAMRGGGRASGLAAALAFREGRLVVAAAAQGGGHLAQPRAEAEVEDKRRWAAPTAGLVSAIPDPDQMVAPRPRPARPE